MKILLTGSSGFLGYAIAEILSRDYEIVGLDLTPGKFTTHVGDVSDYPLILELTRGVTAIIHTASLHAPHVPKLSRGRFVDVNIKGTLNLLEAAVKNKVQRFVYTSTTSLYGKAMVSDKQAVWVTEELKTEPRDIYDITKIAAEQLCEDFARTYDLSVICLRTSRFWNEPDHLKAIYRLYRGVDVRDAAKAHLLALQSQEIKFDIFNISADSPFKETDLIQLQKNAPEVICKYFPEAPDYFARLGWKLPQSIDRVYVITKAKNRLNYQPEYNFHEFVKSLSCFKLLNMIN